TKLIELYGNKEEKNLVLRAEEGVPIEKVVKILDIANRNKIKTVLAVNPK
ncbi:MAG: biopolymer transporter ExbD, partial [Flavobacterium sp.]